jgi:tetratricopeptide (TPR) repeat protein
MRHTAARILAARAFVARAFVARTLAALIPAALPIPALPIPALLIPALLVPAAALAACPPPPDLADAEAAALTALMTAPTEDAARTAEADLWAIYLAAPDRTAQDLLDAAIARRDAYDFAAAEQFLDGLVAYCPDYPEGYNQRAFVRFLRGNYDGALEDLDVILDANPAHFGALAGRGLVLMRQGRVAPGQQALIAAHRLHPFLRERHMILDQFRDPALRMP